MLDKMVGWLVGLLCLTSHRQRGHLETVPPFTVPCEEREAQFLHRPYWKSNHGSDKKCQYEDHGRSPVNAAYGLHCEKVNEKGCAGLSFAPHQRFNIDISTA